jgi:hypothetical protein
MPQQKLSPLTSVFCAAAPSDEALLAQWERHLTPLVQAGHMTLWSEQHLLAGSPRTEQIHDSLERADLLMLLLSADFFASEECIALMEHALRRHQDGKARLIPLLLRPVAWQESPLASLSCVPPNQCPVTEWQNPDAAFDDCVRQLRRILGPSVTTAPTHKRVLVEEQNRERMLLRLRRTYEELFAQLLQGVTQMELGLSDKPDAVQSAASLLLRTSTRPERLLPPGTSILDVYDEATNALLILGALGAGKSTLLVELAQQLVGRAEADDRHPLPVILPLSSWAIKRPPLHLWLVEQVAQIYAIPKNIAQQWVNEDRLLPLLDGLDEVEQTARAACIAAINAHHHDHLRLSLVVCSRQSEYEQASKSQFLALQNAVVVQPLTREQIQAYLTLVGQPLLALRRVLRTNSTLAEVATTPLMVHILILTYQGTSVRRLSTQREQLESQVWTDYLTRMVERKGHTMLYPLHQTRSWLGWLAHQMRSHNQTVFYLEQMQPDWLTDKLQPIYKWLGVRLPAMIIGALVSVLIGWFFVGFSGFLLDISGWKHILQESTIGGLLGGLLCPIGADDAAYSIAKTWYRWGITLSASIGIGLIMGLSIGGGIDADITFNNWLFNGLISGGIFSWNTLLLQFLLSLASSRRFSPSSGRWVVLSGFIQQQQIQRALFITLLIGLSYGVSVGLGAGLRAGFNYGLSIGLGLGLASVLIGVILERLPGGVRLTERVTWTWGNLRNSLLAFTHLRLSIVLTGCISIFVGLCYLLGGRLSDWFTNWLRYGLGVGLSVGLLYWLIWGLYQSIAQERIEDQDRRVPNQGIRQSLRNSLLLGLLIGAMIGGMGIVTLGLSVGLSYGLSVGLSISLSNFWLLFVASSVLSWMITGGLAVWRHYLIRMLLRCTHSFPLNTSQFLDDATARILLQRLGGGYRFTHRLLLDFLADSTR